MKKFVLIAAVILFFIGIFAVSAYKNYSDKKYGVSEKQDIYIPDKAKTILNSGIAHIKSKQTELAIKDFQHLTKLYPKLALGYYNLGLAYIQSNDVNNAINVWNEALKYDNKYQNVYYNLGLAYKIAGDKDKAVSNFAKYLLVQKSDNANDVKKEISELRQPYYGEGSIGLVLFSDEVDKVKALIAKPKIVFTPESDIIYSTVEVSSLQENAQVRAVWSYSDFELENVNVNSSIVKLTGSKNILLSLKKPSEKWPTGTYTLSIFVNDKLEATPSFYIID